MSKTTPAHAHTAKQPNLYRIPIPGGSATFYKHDEVPVRRQREIDVVATQATPIINRIRKAQAVTVDGEQPAEPEDDEVGSTVIGDSGMTLDEGLQLTADLTRDELRLMLELNDTAAWAYLKSWTLKIDLPATPEDLLDLPPKVYDAVQKHGAKLYRLNDTADEFTVDGVEDPASPTGGSDD